MWAKINAMAVKGYLAVKSFFDKEPQEELYRLRDDDRGVSPVVATVLLIMVAVLAALLVWQLLGKYIQDLFKQINNKTKF